MTLDQGQRMTLTFDIRTGSCNHLVTLSTNFDITDYNSLKNKTKNKQTNKHCYLFPIWPCRKIGQGQPRVTVWTKLVVLENPMMHANFKTSSAVWFRSRRVLSFLPYIYMGMATIWECDLNRLSKLSFHHPMEAPNESWLGLAKRFLKRKYLKSVNDKGRTDDRGLSIL